MRTRFAAAAALIGSLVGLAASGPAAAQSRATTADLIVIINDDSGGVIPGTTVSVSNDDTGLSRTGTTGAAGRLSVPALPPVATRRTLRSPASRRPLPEGSL
jgi:hypothetical protein